MVGSSYDQKPYRRSMMETWGATVHRSPSYADRGRTRRRRAIRPGSLGIAISEAVEVAAQRRGHQLRARLGAQPRAACTRRSSARRRSRQLGMAGEEPGRRDRLRRRRLELRRDRVPVRARVCCAGEASTRFVAAEPAACPTLTRGVYRYDFGDTVGLTPLMPMYTLGHDFVPPPMHAGGLRYHGDSPMVCGLVKAGRRRGARLPPERDLRGGAALRAHRGDHPGAGGRRTRSVPRSRRPRRPRRRARSA